MNTLVVSISSFAPDEGGAERQLREVGERLATTHGWQVVVVSHARAGRPARSQVRSLDVERAGRAGSGRVGKAALAVQLAAAIRRRRPDVVVASQLGASATAAWLATAGGRRRPYVVRLSGGGPGGAEIAVRGAAGRGRRAWLRRLLGDAAAVVAPARHLLDGAVAFDPGLAATVRLVPNGTIGPAATTEHTTDVVWVGRDDPVKQPDVLRAVAAACPQLRFAAAGLEPSPADPTNLAALGRLADVAPVVAGATVLLSTSAFEGSPNAVLEALALGTPVVGFASPGLDELGAAVRTVAAGDVDALAAAVVEAVASPAAVTTTPPTYDDAAARWNELLAALLNPRR